MEDLTGDGGGLSVLRGAGCFGDPRDGIDIAVLSLLGGVNSKPTSEPGTVVRLGEPKNVVDSSVAVAGRLGDTSILVGSSTIGFFGEVFSAIGCVVERANDFAGVERSLPGPGCLRGEPNSLFGDSNDSLNGEACCDGGAGRGNLEALRSREAAIEPCS
jgi:hypothetical protein